MRGNHGGHGLRPMRQGEAFEGGVGIQPMGGVDSYRIAQVADPGDCAGGEVDQAADAGIVGIGVMHGGFCGYADRGTPRFHRPVTCEGGEKRGGAVREADSGVAGLFRDGRCAVRETVGAGFDEDRQSGGIGQEGRDIGGGVERAEGQRTAGECLGQWRLAAGRQR